MTATAHTPNRGEPVGDRLSGQIALVTGATGGIGHAVSHRLAAEGATVVVTDVDAGRCDDLAKELTSDGARALGLALDVSDEEAWRGAVERVVAELGGLSVLVNNAGIAEMRTVETETQESWDKVIAVTQGGVWLGMKHAGPAIERSGGGSIINIASIFGTVGGFGSQFSYHAAKGAVRLMTKNAALHWATRGVRVNSIHPGFIETPLLPGTVAGHAPAHRHDRGHPDGAAGPTRRGRGRGGVPGLPGRDLHHGIRAVRGRRLDGPLTRSLKRSPHLVCCHGPLTRKEGRGDDRAPPPAHVPCQRTRVYWFTPPTNATVARPRSTRTSRWAAVSFTASIWLKALRSPNGTSRRVQPSLRATACASRVSSPSAVRLSASRSSWWASSSATRVWALSATGPCAGSSRVSAYRGHQPQRVAGSRRAAAPPARPVRSRWTG